MFIMQINLSRATAHAVSCRPLSPKARVWSQASTCEIYGG